MPLPDFIIIGAPKCGTTSLFQYLGDHPLIHKCPQKEPHFYSYIAENRPHWGIGNVDDYAALFQGAEPDQLCVEASTWYLYSETAAEQISEYAPDTKCIALLRQPVERAYSNWSFRVQMGWETLGFEEAIAAEEKRIEEGAPWDVHYLRAGLYFEQVRRFYEELGRKQVRVFLFDDFKHDSDTIVRKAFSFLGVDPSDREVDTEKTHNATNFPRIPAVTRLKNTDLVRQGAKIILPEPVRSILRRKIREWNTRERPSLDPTLRKELTDRIWSDIERLERLIGADLSHWAA